MEPYITKFPPSANVVEGEKYKLKCEAYGEPEPVIEWQKCESWNASGCPFARSHLMDCADGVPKGGVPLVPEDYRVTVTDDTLSILEMNVTDACNYTCTATSSLGSFSRSITIRVIGTSSTVSVSNSSTSQWAIELIVFSFSFLFRSTTRPQTSTPLCGRSWASASR